MAMRMLLCGTLSVTPREGIQVYRRFYSKNCFYDNVPIHSEYSRSFRFSNGFDFQISTTGISPRHKTKQPLLPKVQSSTTKVPSSEDILVGKHMGNAWVTVFSLHQINQTPSPNSTPQQRVTSMATTLVFTSNYYPFRSRLVAWTPLNHHRRYFLRSRLMTWALLLPLWWFIAQTSVLKQSAQKTSLDELASWPYR